MTSLIFWPTLLAMYINPTLQFAKFYQAHVLKNIHSKIETIDKAVKIFHPNVFGGQNKRRFIQG